MSAIHALIDLFLHLDTHLQSVILQYGQFTYAILFAIIFCETGLVVTPFLPGDSLLFAAGTFAGLGALNPWLLFALLVVAAILGDGVNYMLGAMIGPRVFSGRIRFLKKEHLERTERFYKKYGSKTIVIARFIPIVRTFAPFVAGAGNMHYRTFALFNVIGAVLWVALFVFAGTFFGNVPFVRDHFSVVIMAIILLSLVPPVIEWIHARKNARTVAS